MCLRILVNLLYDADGPISSRGSDSVENNIENMLFSNNSPNELCVSGPSYNGPGTILDYTNREHSLIKAINLNFDLYQ